jgi:hypothetical protein
VRTVFCADNFNVIDITRAKLTRKEPIRGDSIIRYRHWLALVGDSQLDRYRGDRHLGGVLSSLFPGVPLLAGIFYF